LTQPGERVIEVAGAKSQCDVTFLAPKDLALKVTKGFEDLTPVGKAIKEQHLSAGTTIKGRRTQFLAVLTPRRGKRTEQMQMEYQSIEDGHAARLRRKGWELVLLWQPDEKGGALEAYGARSQRRVYAKLSLAAAGKVVELLHGER
jgi:hypothetical protein